MSKKSMLGIVAGISAICAITVAVVHRIKKKKKAKIWEDFLNSSDFEYDDEGCLAPAVKARKEEVVEEAEKPVDKFDVSRYSHFRNVNKVDKAKILEELELKTGKRFTNIPEDVFKMFISVLHSSSDEEITKWCVENLEEVREGTSEKDRKK